MYDTLLTSLLSILATPEWRAELIEVYPNNYQGDINNKNEYCRVAVMPTSSKNHAYGGSVAKTGLVAFKIFVKAGDGQNRIMEIANTLDSHYENKNIGNGIVIGTSYISSEGLDSENQTLFSASYFIPFTYYGD